MAISLFEIHESGDKKALIGMAANPNIDDFV